MTISIPPSVEMQGLSEALPSDNKDLRKVAEGFEAIFVRKILETARAADFGGDDIFGGQGMETFTVMRDEHVADIAASTGAFGFADSIEKQLAARLPGGGRK